MTVWYSLLCSAGVAHLVERHLAKVEVASSSLVARSIKHRSKDRCCFFCGLLGAHRRARPIGAPCWRDNRGASSKSARCIRHWRRFADFLVARSIKHRSKDRCFSFPQAFRHSPGHFALRRDLLCPRRQKETNATPFFSGLSEKNGVARQKEIAFATVLSCSFVWCFVIGKGESVDELVQPPSPLPLIRCAKECPAQTCERSRRISSVRRRFDKFVYSLHQAMHKRQR